MTIKRRVAVLEGGRRRKVEDIFIVNDLPDPGEPGGLRCRFDDQVVYANPGEEYDDFRKRCHRLAPHCTWFVYGD